MTSKTSIKPPRRPWLALALSVLFAAGALSDAVAEEAPRRELDVLLNNAVAYLRTRQDEQGAFGAEQPHLQTGFAVLALLSVQAEPADGDVQRLERAAGYLLRTGSRAGDLGDEAFGTESHAVAATALLCALPHLRDAELRIEVSERLYRAIRLTQRMQDRSASSAAHGGWKMDGFKGRENDRRASAWALLQYHTCRRYGLDIPEANMDRAVHFLLGSFKDAADNPDQVGGMSVDAEGLAVESMSAIGGWILAHVQPNAERGEKNLSWLIRHPPRWSGPNYFYANFFRVRALMALDLDGADEALARSMRLLYLQLRDHQAADGSIAFPPGNAQNTVAMGPVFSTSLAVLILNAPNSRLVSDEDFRLKPLF